MNQLRVVFLGTGAGLPSRSRNVAAVAIVMDGRSVLFDCGEGTQQQLLRSSVRLQSIESICITHLHGDHCYGLPGLLGTMSLSGRTTPLRLFGPSGFREYIEGVMRTTRLNLHYDVTVDELTGGDEIVFAGFAIRAAELEHSRLCLGFLLVEDDRAGMFDLERARELGVPVGPLFAQLQRGDDVVVEGRTVHSTEVVGETRAGRRIAYCTDTRPCEATVTLARGADLLIHEATYGNDMAAEAAERFHSTASEAASIAERAGVKQLVLTHISPRYEDASLLVNEARAVFTETGAAFDFFEIVVAR